MGAADASFDALLENAGWVRELARHILADAGAADDVAQDTWLAALRGAPSGPALRPWLARVARNFALQRARSETARAKREQIVARPEHAPSGDETVARAELHARLVQAVLALDEPFRTTILWRYFDELEPDEIARRARIDLATVRSRLKRGRDRLREALTERDGTRPEAWLGALLAVDRNGPAAATTSWIGGTLMSVKLATVSALAAVAACIVWWAWPATSTRGTGPMATLDERRSTIASSTTAADPSAVAEASSRSPAVDLRAAPATAQVADTLLHGVVLGADGRRPLAGARVSHRRGPEIDRGLGLASLGTEAGALDVRADESGRFAIDAPSDASIGLFFESDGYLPLKLSSEDLPRASGGEIEAVLAPFGVLDVRVVDERGAPVEGVDLSWSVTLDRGSNDQRWAFRADNRGAKTDAAGRASIERVPCGMQIALTSGRMFLDRSVLGSGRVDVETRRGSVELRLARRGLVSGRLVSSAGDPVAGVEVRWVTDLLEEAWAPSARPDADGKFVLAELAAGAGRVHVDVAGIEPVSVELAPGEHADVGDIVVPESVTLSGNVVSALVPIDSVLVRVFRGGRQICVLQTDREGWFEWQVSHGELLLLATRGGNLEVGGTHPGEVLATLALREPAAGLTLPIDGARGAIAATVADPAPGRALDVHVYRRDGNALESTAQFDARPTADGRFEIGPFEPGEYAIHVCLPDRGDAFVGGVTVETGRVTDVGVLVFATGALAGRIVDATGEPVAHATVAARMFAGIRAYTGEALSGEDGRYRLDDVPAGVLYDVKAKQAEVGLVRVEWVAIANGATTELDLQLAAFATIEGVVSDAGGPVASAQLMVQPVSSNDDFSSSTDAEGRFRIERLPPGRLRVWTAGRGRTHVVDVAPGETRSLDIELGELASLRFVSGEQPLAGVDRVYATPLEAFDRGEGRWSRATLRDDRVEIELLETPVLFDVHTQSLGNGESYVAIARTLASTGEVELARRELVLDAPAPWLGPLPVATLTGFGGAAVGPWGREIQLAVELGADGRARVPHLPAGAIVRLGGLDARGKKLERTVDTGTDAVATVPWR